MQSQHTRIRYVKDKDEAEYIRQNEAHIEKIIKLRNPDNEILYIAHPDFKQILCNLRSRVYFVANLLVPEIFHEGQRKKNAVDSQDNAASTKPVNSRKGFYLDDIVGTFGVPVKEHRKESEVKQMDGYVSMGILTGKIAPEAGKD